jgi:hypothetical protein
MINILVPQLIIPQLAIPAIDILYCNLYTGPVALIYESRKKSMIKFVIVH